MYNDVQWQTVAQFKSHSQDLIPVDSYVFCYINVKVMLPKNVCKLINKLSNKKIMTMSNAR